MRHLVLSILALFSLAAARPDLHGRVLSAVDSQPLSNATAFIYTAGVKTGTSPYCPGCYADCSKHAAADSAGNFTIPSLDPTLLFRVLVVADGYKPTFVTKVDPAAGPISVALQPVPHDINPTLQLKGRVIDPQGHPVLGAIVYPVYPGDIDPIAVTDAAGRFTMIASKLTLTTDLHVESRGLDPRIFHNVRLGIPQTDFQLTTGATVTGRIVKDGKALPNILVGIVQQNARTDSFTGDRTISTDSAGHFTFLNIAPPGQWNIYPIMSSLQGIGGAHYQAISIAGDDSLASAGDIPITQGCTLTGQVLLADHKPLPPDTRIMISRDYTWDSQILTLDKDGRFTATDFPAGESISICLRVKDYHFSKQNQSVDFSDALIGQIRRDTTLTILLDPGPFNFPKYDPALFDQRTKRSTQEIAAIPTP